MSYQKLRGAIREKYGTQAAFAEAIRMHPATLSSKLRGRTDWTRQEIVDACLLLSIPAGSEHSYFFTP